MSKIISIGNISMGGTGKTPFTIMLAEHFIKLNKKICILSRGYKGKIGLETNVICDGKDILLKPPLAADEPYMIAKTLKKAIVITGKERIKSFAYAKKQFSPEIFILDDGYQHTKIPRNVNILLLDHNNPISTGFPFPFGYLREFPSSIKRADIIVFTRAKSETIPEKVKKYIKNKPCFFSNITTSGFFDSKENKKSIEIKKYKYIAFSGIAKNKSFFNELNKQKLNIVKTVSFKDHHIYNIQDENKLFKLLKKYKCDLFVTTEKDFVKLSENLRNKTFYLRIKIDLNNKEKFFELIRYKINE